MKRQSIFLKTNALLVLITAAACLVAAVQLWVGYQVSHNGQRIKNFAIPVAVGSMSMRGELADISSNLLEYSLGEAEEKAAYYINLEQFKIDRSQLPMDKELEAKMGRVDVLFSQLQEDAEERVFGVYDPNKELQARRGIGRLQRDVGKPLVALLRRLKSEELSDAATDKYTGSIALDDFQGLHLYLELTNVASNMLSDLDKFVLGDVTARRAFHEKSLSFEVLLARLKPLETRPEELLSIREIERLFKELKSGGVSIFSLYRTSDRADALQVVDELERVGGQELLRMLDEIASESRRLVKEKISILGDLVFRTNIILLSCLALTIGIAVFGTLFIRRRIIVPIGLVTEIIRRLREGERKIVIDKPENIDEISDILKALDEFQVELRELDQLRERQIEQYKELEARGLQLQSKSDALEAANRDLEQFVHIASHDLREPLKQISGFAELLVFQTDELEDSDIRNTVDHLQKYSVRMCVLIDDLRALSRVSGVSLEIVPCDLGELLGAVLTDNSQLVKERDPQIHTEVLPITNCNSVLMRQVFENLLQNALNHGSDPLCVNVMTSDVQVEGGSVAFEFSNTCDNDQIDKERILLPFVQGARTKDRGTGMGLAICKKIIEVHGGRIEVEADGCWFKVLVQL